MQVAYLSEPGIYHCRVQLNYAMMRATKRFVNSASKLSTIIDLVEMQRVACKHPKETIYGPETLEVVLKREKRKWSKT